MRNSNHDVVLVFINCSINSIGATLFISRSSTIVLIYAFLRLIISTEISEWTIYNPHINYSINPFSFPRFLAACAIQSLLIEISSLVCKNRMNLLMASSKSQVIISNRFLKLSNLLMLKRESINYYTFLSSKFWLTEKNVLKKSKSAISSLFHSLEVLSFASFW